MNEYSNKVLNTLKEKYSDQPEYLQATEEIMLSLDRLVPMHPEYESNALFERYFEPERVIMFRVPWTDDNGKIRVNTGYRVQYNSAIGPYKGGLRFRNTVNLSIMKFLGLEQTLKNSLTGLPIGGAKGGSDFDPASKSDGEIMRFCQSFMTELYKYISADKDVPAGDIGVGAREIGYLYGQYKRLTGLYEGVLTGKGLSFGGSLARKEATGYGACYFAENMLGAVGKTLKGKKIVISGSGNVALYACQKAIAMGAKVIAMSDSKGYVYDENGIDINTMIDIKEKRRERISAYANEVSSAVYHEGASNIYSLPCDIAMPCATQNELDKASAEKLIKNGCIAVVEGANMPCTLEAVKLLQSNNVMFAPAKAANAGGVAVSALEMSQNSMRLSWTFEEVDDKLKQIMHDIFSKCASTAEQMGEPGNYLLGANIAGFLKVADAMLAQGAV